MFLASNMSRSTPTDVEQPFEPLFDLPDYTAVGKTLLNLAYAGPRDDSADHYYAADIESVMDVKKLLEESGAFSIDRLELPQLGEYHSWCIGMWISIIRSADDDDPFQISPPSTRVPSRATTTRSSSRTDATRPPTRAAAIRATQTSTRPVPPVTRSSKTLSSGAQTAATIRVTRSTTAIVAGPSRPSRMQNSSNAPPATGPVKTTTRGASRVAAPLKAVVPPTRTAPVRDSRSKAGGVAPSIGPIRANAGPSGSRVAAATRADGARTVPRTADARLASAASVTLQTDDILQFDLGDAIFEDDFQFTL